jgi:hypothetical protein
MTIQQNKIRVGNFNSSEIVALTTKDRSGKGFGKPALTFIEECNFERRLGRSISDEVTAKPLSWGKLCEKYVQGMLLGEEYVHASQETNVHPTIDYWVGSKDGIKHDEGKTVADIKCPMTLKSFCQLVQPLYDANSIIELTENEKGTWAINKIRSTHKDGEKYYWQLVSNGIINGCKYAELQVFMPYESELASLKFLAEGNESLYWLSMAKENELPFIKDGGFYQNLSIIRFEIPQEDIDFLTDCVEKAGKMLVNYQ